jgi:DNA-binding SARP family transcriptional activator
VPAAEIPVPSTAPHQVPSLLAEFADWNDAEDQEMADQVIAEGAGEAKDGGTPAVVEAAAQPAPHDQPASDDGRRDESTASLPRSGARPVRTASPSVTVSLPDPADGPSAAPPASTMGPAVRVLGPVDVIGARGTTESRRERTSTELAAWLALHPGHDHHALDEALWPGREANRKVRNSTVTRLRSWLGTDADGVPYLPTIASAANARYALADTVTCDWHQFRQLADTGMNSCGPQADQALRQALELVRGRPFASVNPRRYVWAEHLTQDMISAIVDVAGTLAERCLTARDPRGALWAATKGLEAAPEMESLYRILFQGYAAVGDLDGLERAAQQLDQLNEELDVELEDATADLLRQLLTPT